MGIQNKGNTLVAMTNGDIYYVTQYGTERLIKSIEEKEQLFSFIDASSGKRVRIQVPHVSSIVEGGSRNG